MEFLRVVGDVHGQVDDENLITRGARSYLDIIASAPFSVQLGDMGDRETYAFLREHVDARRHRFFPGNHDHHDELPPHCLGDFGDVNLGGVRFFFARGAASMDKEKLLRVGRQLGKTLWDPREELDETQMSVAEESYRRSRPAIVITHEAPAEIAPYIWNVVARTNPSVGNSSVHESRTSRFLQRLLDWHRPRLWLFGHYHRDWFYEERETSFVCVGQLSYADVSAHGEILDLGGVR